MALIGVRDLSWGFSNPPLLENITFQMEKGERVGLQGRNGAGKSTLLRLLQGEILPDSGQVWRQQGVTVAYLSQSVPLDFEGSIFEVVAGGLGPKGKDLAEYRKGIKTMGDGKDFGPPPPAFDSEDWWTLVKQVETVLSRTQLPAEDEFADLSAGMKRRTLFARAMVAEPDILLLDEPTNHLDIESILWMENFICRYVKTLLFVTHDRAFLRKLATRILELDRGHLFSYTCDYETFLKRRQAFLEAEENQADLFDKKLSQEEAWIRQGIKARRTRNEGRVTALIKMREAFQARRKKTPNVKLQIQEAERTGKLVIEAEHLSFDFGETPVVRDFSTIILRGDKVGIIGPNGVGKTTLLNLLLKKNIPPQTGRVRHGTHLQIAYFDQLRVQLDEEKTVLENVGEGNDFIDLNGQRRHLIGYLQDFLFSPEKSRTPVKVLSGGEKNRLMLAKLFTRPANVLVLDEPTNDLDMETLELLEELLFDYQGTLLLVSHDRTFLNNVVASTLAFEEQGKVVHYAGGYDDWLIQRPQASENSPTKKRDREKKVERSPQGLQKLGYKERRELEDLPQQINALETERQELFETWSDPLFYRKGKEEMEQIKTRLAQLEQALETAYFRWEELEDRS
jgi:ATP-binding cassette subfamily F protein uup